MKLYTDTELDNDIKYVKEILNRYSKTYKNIEEKFSKIQKTFESRVCFIVSQFRNLFIQNRMWI